MLLLKLEASHSGMLSDHPLLFGPFSLPQIVKQKLWDGLRCRKQIIARAAFLRTLNQKQLNGQH